ncbi:hypothetical protein [Ensifer sp. SSB1]|jgi:hypothetical protein|uniref:hypothetical protein n=1 Tax=Ensifer sp. SSB1 TaxID=2795385 RepID=UPI001A3E76B3|nr:hypothetical protein [Ensifer sp. SSB1]MBK5566640.1 hypothetical protein [Ensifer sp. SSB1]
MSLFRAIHATKVLALAGLVIATTCIPLEARDGGGARGFQMRTNHMRMSSDRSFPGYQVDRSGYRNGWNRNRMPRRDWMANNGLPEVETRTRHVRLPQYRPYPGYGGGWEHRGGWARDRAGNDVWTSGGRRHDGRRGIDNGLPEVETRTRHVRLPQYRPYPGPYADRWGNGGGWVRDRAGREIWTSGGQRRDYRPNYYGSYGNDEYPDTVPGIGTYVGGISAYVDVGNGIYFNQEGDYGYSDDGTYAPPPQSRRGKIINVTPQTMNSSCAYEHGVCVIRR